MLMVICSAFCGGWVANEWQHRRELERAQQQAESDQAELERAQIKAEATQLRAFSAALLRHRSAQSAKDAEASAENEP